MVLYTIALKITYNTPEQRYLFELINKFYLTGLMYYWYRYNKAKEC
jgi:hypothetical protein